MIPPLPTEPKALLEQFRNLQKIQSDQGFPISPVQLSLDQVWGLIAYLSRDLDLARSSSNDPLNRTGKIYDVAIEIS